MRRRVLSIRNIHANEGDHNIAYFHHVAKEAQRENIIQSFMVMIT